MRKHKIIHFSRKVGQPKNMKKSNRKSILKSISKSISKSIFSPKKSISKILILSIFFEKSISIFFHRKILIEINIGCSGTSVDGHSLNPQTLIKSRLSCSDVGSALRRPRSRGCSLARAQVWNRYCGHSQVARYCGLCISERRSEWIDLSLI